MNLSMPSDCLDRLGVKRGVHSCTGKFCMHLHRYKDTDINKVRKRMFDKKCLLGRKSHGSIIITTLEVLHISAHLALELSCKELEMLFTQCSQAPKHNGEWLDRKQ